VEGIVNFLFIFYYLLKGFIEEGTYGFRCGGPGRGG
jgi:hypothetical protein